MTNHAELSRDLALVIGYAPNEMLLQHGEWWVFRQPDPVFGPTGWKQFDYRDPTVVMPLLLWLNTHYGVREFQDRRYAIDYFIQGYRRWPIYDGYFSARADTLPECVARAVIEVSK